MNVPGRRRRDWAAAIAASALLLFAATLADPAKAQDGIPLPPHWFWGTDFDAFEGAEVRAVAVDGAELGSVTIEDGRWLLYLASDDGRMIRFYLLSNDSIRLSRQFELRYGELTRVRLSDFSSAQTTAPVAPSIQIIARLLEDGRIEFGLRDAAGREILPERRLFPANAIPERWLHSSVVELDSGVRGRIIARRLDNGRTEFGFRVSGFDDFLPQRRYFPIDPDQGRWLRSSPIEIPAAD